MGIFGSTGIWFLIGAILVWFMQAGFAMVETGFTRAKNAGNIIMKNLMDFCLGTIVFVLLGAGLMMTPQGKRMKRVLSKNGSHLARQVADCWMK